MQARILGKAMQINACKILFILALLGTSFSGWAQGIRDGQLDLRSWDFDEEPLLPLRGHWDFYWSRLYAPEDFQSGTTDSPEWIRVPGSWSLVTDHPTQGVATYRLRVQLKEPRPLALHSPWILSSAKIFIDGVLLEELGRVGRQREPNTGQSYVRDDVWTFTPRSSTFDIIIQVANHESMMAGFPHAPTLGTAKAIRLSYLRELSLALALIGSFMLMGVYHLCLFALRTEVRSTLFFGLVCITNGLYVFGAEGTVVATFLPDVGYPVRLRLILSWMLVVPAFVYFTRELFPAYFSKFLAHGAAIVSVGLFASFWMMDITKLPYPFYVYQGATALLLFYSLGVFIKTLRNKEDGAQIFAIGLSVLAATGINDLLRAVIDSRPLVGFGLLFFIICQSFLLARRFSRAFIDLAHSEHQVRQLNENLEGLVEEKTREIRSIMDHIQLGIFAITGPGRRIHKDFSRYLQTLFHQKELTNVDAAELLFDKSQLTSDERQQATQALEAMLGEPSLAFELNCSALPHETLYTEGQGITRIIDLSWHPVIDSHDTIEKILVTARDVTHLRTLEDEAQDRKEELQFIQELLNISPEAFNRFIENCREFLEENRKLVNSRSIALRDMEALKVLYINVHTLKGAARSLYLKKITRIFHDVEQYYALLQKDPHVHWDVERMNRDLDEAQRMLATYETINSNKLGRRMAEEGRLVVPSADLIQLYRALRELEPDSKVSSMQNLLLPLVYRPVQEMLEDVLSCADMLARDLQKLPPLVNVKAHGFYMEQLTDNLLRRVFIHIIRNSMDHGIELPAVRTAQGKNPRGLIEVRVTAQEDWISIHYHDDGQGLNLSRLCEIAREQGIISSEEELSRQERAELIFRSGLSTAKNISDVSGRGMGKDAVKKYLEAAGGRIMIHLLSQDPQGMGTPFALEIRLPAASFIQADASAVSTPAA
jgi:signal transduction histidine kinase